ncbi:NUDIX domain-containing protein [Jannaschia ovalis]|uniref:ADP-ribose pyrophosphatase n=1 Tax=Jannaschia ovalis TaxID=3038773 RepID=A0ABY8LE55_9RHOB|nr:NUDIX domain-containing protein [Jannaschia sp. GRR-S6-38]WGH78434.1 NUDIX domain-containing protein [Jannaschia sp. GRR-S6-38]
MSRYFLFGTLRWQTLLTEVAGRPVACTPATLTGWSVERAARGDWPVLVEGGSCTGLLTEPLDAGPRARLDWYETAFDYAPEAVTVGAEPALVYRADDAGAGEGWDLDAWIAAHGARTRLAAAEVMRGLGRVSQTDLAARRGMIHARADGTLRVRGTRRPVTTGPSFTVDDIEVLGRRHPHDGFTGIEEWRIDHPRFDGSRSGPLTRTVATTTDAATVLPYDPVRDRVLVVEQVRMGALANGDPQPWMIEPVAGMIDAGEGPEACALRELEEEAGLRAPPEALHFVARYYPSPGVLAQLLHSYVVTCDLPDGAAGLGGLDAEHEDLRLHLLALDDLLAMIPSGEAANAPLVASAQWLALNRERLRAG